MPSSFKRDHGGARQGSGRKKRSETLGPVNKRNGLQNFGFSSQEQRQINVLPSARTTQQEDESKEEANIASTIRAQLAEGTGIEQPNFDADELFDETVFNKGKKINQSQNLQLQRACIAKKAYYTTAYKKVEETGVLWDIPPSIIKKTEYNLRKRWLDFFKMKVFNWIPEAMIHKDWRPYCPTCHQKLSRNGHNLEARLVFDQHDNYWLNAPNRYVCRDCELNSKDTDNTNNYHFRSTSDEIMKQIKDTHPELIQLFPCHITSKMRSIKN